MDANKDLLFFFGGSSISVSDNSIDDIGGNDSCTASLLVCCRPCSVANHSGMSFSRSLLNFLSAEVELGKKLNDLNPGSRKVAIQ